MRTGKCERTTTETSVKVTVNLDGKGKINICTGVEFLDHMLQQLAFHARLDLTIDAKGDRQIDDHHTVEDVGIALGRALREAVGEAHGIHRYGSFLLVMDEALVRSVVDVSGRPYLVWNVAFSAEKIGGFDTELVQEFFQALAMQGGWTLHVDMLDGTNAHHIAECCFKSVARALRMAVEMDPRAGGKVPSTKGVLGDSE